MVKQMRKSDSGTRKKGMKATRRFGRNCQNQDSQDWQKKQDFHLQSNPAFPDNPVNPDSDKKRPKRPTINVKRT
jgi:hypothetical protein